MLAQIDAALEYEFTDVNRHSALVYNMLLKPSLGRIFIVVDLVGLTLLIQI